jgi:hypothetical protein
MADVNTRTVKVGDTWAGQCANPCGFKTVGWPTKKLAEARIAEHAGEHETGEAMRDLQAFREDHGIIVSTAGDAVFEDLED